MNKRLTKLQICLLLVPLLAFPMVLVVSRYGGIGRGQIVVAFDSAACSVNFSDDRAPLNSWIIGANFTISYSGAKPHWWGWSLTLAPGDAGVRTVLIQMLPNQDASLTTPKEVLLKLFAETSGTMPAIDAVKAVGAPQTIAGIEWSQDGSIWHMGTGPAAVTVPLVLQDSTIGFRAIKGNPNLPWPEGDFPGSLPIWRHGTNGFIGETAWIQFKAVTPPGSPAQQVVAMCSTEVSVSVRVRPWYDVQLTSNKGAVLGGAGSTTLKQAIFTALVADEGDEPLQGVKVRFRARYADGTTAGEIGAVGTTDDIVITDAQGEAGVTWTSGAFAGEEARAEVFIEAQAIDENNSLTGEQGLSTIMQLRPIVYLDYGTWIEDTIGDWSRSIKATVWFQGEKISGSGVQLAYSIVNNEEAPMAGWQNAAPLDATTGISNSSGEFSTIQRWEPVDASELPADYFVTVTPTIAN
jgi:hypothetical protein